MCHSITHAPQKYWASSAFSFQQVGRAALTVQEPHSTSAQLQYGRIALRWPAVSPHRCFCFGSCQHQHPAANSRPPNGRLERRWATVLFECFFGMCQPLPEHQEASVQLRHGPGQQPGARGVTPRSVVALLMSTLFWMSKRTTSTWPDWLARCKGVAPMSVRARLMSAPVSRSKTTTSRCPCAAAEYKAVAPSLALGLLMSTPTSKSKRTTSTWPYLAARCRAPPLCFGLGRFQHQHLAAGELRPNGRPGLRCTTLHAPKGANEDYKSPNSQYRFSECWIYRDLPMRKSKHRFQQIQATVFFHCRVWIYQRLPELQSAIGQPPHGPEQLRRTTVLILDLWPLLRRPELEVTTQQHRYGHQTLLKARAPIL